MTRDGTLFQPANLPKETLLANIDTTGMSKLQKKKLKKKLKKQLAEEAGEVIPTEESGGEDNEA